MITNNILEGKYIILYKNQIEIINRKLYDLGYRWNGSHDNEEMFDRINYPKFVYNNDGFLYLYNSEYLCVSFWVPEDRTELNIKKLLREEKLKRILK